MAAPLSLDLRERIVERYRLGRETYTELAALFNVGEASVSRVLRRARERGNVMPNPPGGGFPPRIADDDLPKLEKLVVEKADRTIEDLCAAWNRRYGGPITTSSMSRSLQRARLTRKKSFSVCEQERPDVQDRRHAFIEEVSAIEPDRLVFLDESGCNLAMNLSYGRAPRGQRVADTKPANWGGNITVVGAIKNDRVLRHRTIKGAMNSERFVAYVRELLCPRLYPGDVVVLDNLRAHHASEVRAAIEAVGATVLCMPPYSPDLNPIELCWSFVKGWLRRLRQRTEQGLRAAIRSTLLRVRTGHLEGWFAHCGYGQRK